MECCLDTDLVTFARQAMLFARPIGLIDEKIYRFDW